MKHAYTKWLLLAATLLCLQPVFGEETCQGYSAKEILEKTLALKIGNRLAFYPPSNDSQAKIIASGSPKAQEEGQMDQAHWDNLMKLAEIVSRKIFDLQKNDSQAEIIAFDLLKAQEEGQLDQTHWNQLTRLLEVIALESWDLQSKARHHAANLLRLILNDRELDSEICQDIVDALIGSKSGLCPIIEKLNTMSDVWRSINDKPLLYTLIHLYYNYWCDNYMLVWQNPFRAFLAGKRHGLRLLEPEWESGDQCILID